MESVKNFVKEHKKELGLAAAGVFIYRLGFRNGYATSIGAMKALVNEVSKSLTRF